MNKFVIVRGGGDLATGVIHRLASAGFDVLVLEAQYPAAIRRQVSLSEAVYEGTATVEGLTARLHGASQTIHRPFTAVNRAISFTARTVTRKYLRWMELSA